jgi:hypothetical protein
MKHIEEVAIAGDQSEVDNNPFDINLLMSNIVIIPGSGEEALLYCNSINEAKAAFPRLESCGVVVSWFIDKLEIIGAQIKPGVEKKSFECQDNNTWKVGGYGRDNAHYIAKDGEGSSTVRYGGTMPDEDVINYIKALKANDLEAVFYPFLMVDVDGKPWRGRITGNVEDVHDFYENQYKPFILHYANLLKDQNIDAFLIGSELEGLTSVMSDNYSFPFVLKLVELAKIVKKILGKGVKVSYAANWSEYHSVPGGLRPLDNLWAAPFVDFVGIDAYFPLTDHANSKKITANEIQKNWTSGEGIEYYYQGEFKNNFSTEPWAQWKNLEYWYEENHYSWNSKTEESIKTSWSPKMKPIWFTEYGFSCLDKATNTPNASFPELPKNSTGEYDPSIQIKGISATIEFVNSRNFIEKAFCYGWDSRGLGWQDKKTSDLTSYYFDSTLWKAGHWIDGKIGNKIAK